MMVDGHLIQIGDNAIIAFDILLKLHYCFDVEFASDFANFYDFKTGCVMKLHIPKGCSIALETTLQNITLKENDERYVILLYENDERYVIILCVWTKYFLMFPLLTKCTTNFIIILIVMMRARDRG